MEQLIYFQIRESPTPLNIPTPNPAPDHPLGGHGGTCLDTMVLKRNGLYRGPIRNKLSDVFGFVG